MRLIARTGFLLVLLATQAGAAVTAWVPLDLSSQQPRFPVTIEGRPSRALLDSGTATNVISRSIVEELDIPVHKSRAFRVEGVNVRRSLDGASKVHVNMFGTEIIVDDLLIAPGGFDLILGLGFFKMFIVQLDYPNQRMRLISRGSLNMHKLSNVPTRIGDDGMLDVKLDLNGEKVVWAMLDTGNAGDLLLPKGLVHRLGWLDRYATEQISVVGIHAVAQTFDRFALPRLTIGPFTLSDVPVSVMNKRQSSRDAKNGSRVETSRASRKVGILGYDILRHFVVTLDFLGRELHLAPPERLKDAE